MNIIIEQFRNILILVIFIAGAVAVNSVYKSNNPICPDDFNDIDQQAAALDKWLDGFYENNPDATIADMTKARKDFYIKHNCKEARQRHGDIQSGKTDPKIVHLQ